MTNRLLGKYEIVRLIGQGGSGAVYEAIDPSLSRRVAIKSIPLPPGADGEAVKERFAREARITASLIHRNIVGIYDFGEQDQSLYLVMEYVSGRSLEHVMAETPQAEWWERFLPVLRECAGAIDYVHEKGIVHGDIKPGNIMVQGDGEPKILDFGLARIAHQTNVTQQGSLTGTLSYLAPEMLQNEQATPQADQYALAVIAYQLATGVLPFVADSAYAMLYKVMTEAPSPVDKVDPRIPGAIAVTIAKALSKDPANRFKTCTEFLEQLSQPGARTIARAGPGEFTRMFESPMPYAPAQGVLLPEAAKPQGPGEYTRVFQAPVARPEAPPPPPTEGFFKRSPTLLPQPAPAPQPTSAPHQGWIRRAIGAALQIFRPVPGKSETAPKEAPPPLPAPTPAAPPRLSPSGLVDSPGSTQIEAPPVSSGRPTGGEQTMILRLPVDARLDPRDLARRQAAELIQLAGTESFDAVVVLQGKWLPGVEGADATLLAFREAARYLVAARNASSPHNAVEHLIRAEAVLVAAGNQLLRSAAPAAAEMPAALEVWKGYTRAKLAEGRALMERQLPNPYRAGQPLRPDQGRILFRGRDQIVRQIESVLADANQSGSIALLGPRRCGKTSVLQMLPALLPDCVCVFFDLQDNPVDSTQAFFQALERQAREQSRRDRRVELPPLPDGGSFPSASQWLQELDNLPGTFRILLCLDEFERLEELFPGNRQDLLRLMGLFRATIQHRRRLRLLVSGVAPFDELGQIWNDHFINVREIRVGHLDRTTAMDLLMHPLSDFPADAVPEVVAAHVFERTGGQPYLLQLYGALLIAHLNQQQRRSAVIGDVAIIEEEAMSQGAYYFRHTYESAPPDSRRVLEELAAGRRPDMSPAVHLWLSRRGLVDHERALCIPVLGAYMRDELSLQ